MAEISLEKTFASTAASATGPKEITYEQRVAAEIEHYLAEYQNEESRRTLTQSVPPSWYFVEGRIQERIRAANQGRNLGMEIK
jgi:hypothetical protein